VSRPPACFGLPAGLHAQRHRVPLRESSFSTTSLSRPSLIVRRRSLSPGTRGVPLSRGGRTTEIRGDGQVPGALHKIPEPMVIAALSAATFCSLSHEFSSFADSAVGGCRLRSRAPRSPCSRRANGQFALYYGARLEAEGPQIPGAVSSRWFFGAHAATSVERHLSHEADRLASQRARRAATAPDFRSAGTVGPVPKYISSGVCPRKAA
jgi:hypothetical protein